LSSCSPLAQRLLVHLRERPADGATAWVVQHLQSPEHAAGGIPPALFA
jgi:hypothetical protein